MCIRDRLTVADCTRESSESLVEMADVIGSGALFSIKIAGPFSMFERTGASLTAVISISLDNRLLLSSPSLTAKLIVRVTADGLSLVFL